MNNFPCKCGHTHHDSSFEVNPFPFDHITMLCYIVDNTGKYICSCTKYVRDNLKYLELKYDQQKQTSV